MSRFAKKVQAEESGPFIPAPPSACGCFECDGDVFITMAICKLGMDREITGCLSLRGKDGPSFSRRVPGKGWLSTTDFRFVKWVARCERCYLRENRLDRVMEDLTNSAT